MQSKQIKVVFLVDDFVFTTIESAKKFFPEIEQSKHLGSMYTIRTVLPNKDSTDERPTIVKKQDDNFILFSGKIGNCVEAANEIISIIKK